LKGQGMNDIICPNCGSGETKLHLNTRDYFLTHELFSIYVCLKCKLLFTHPFPEQQVLHSKYYASNNYLSHNKKLSNLFSAAYRLVQKINIRMKLKLINSTNQLSEKKILEVGAGTGDFLAECIKNGWQSCGIEPSEQARLVAKEYNKLNLKSNIDEVGEVNFSIIALWHVLEHIPNLRETILKLNNLLAKNGSLIIAVPNHNSFDAKHYKQFWAGYDVPRHLYHFNKLSLTLIMESYGFKLVKTNPMIFDSYYVSLLSEKYIRKLFIARYLSAIIIGLISNLKALYSGESSSLIFIFKKA
jgi:2-polyprenyl-3-methyl-5-hydroxy-6-metoxy-1,4-benzoquinol methylase